MELSEVTRKNAKAVKAIYHAAFPKEERMPLLDHAPAGQNAHHPTAGLL